MNGRRDNARRKLSGKALGRFHAANTARFDRCIAPLEECDGQAIRAHSIQNSGALDLIAEDGHVMTISLNVTREGTDLAFKRVGRNKASTFTGLCAKHDSALFRPIDASPLDLTNPEHLFLLAYRAVTRELHATMEAAARTRLLFEIGGSKKAGVQFMLQGATAYETNEYRELYFDPIFKTGAFESVEHDVILFDDQPAVLAVSSMFSFLESADPENPPRCVLNVAPLTSTQTAVILSYAPHDAARVRSLLDRVLASQGHYQRYELSRLILEHVENFVLKPSHVDQWSAARQAKIMAAFEANLMDGAVPDDPDMMLF
ncbi:MAG: hypothetical protein H7124_01410 [Phycisphaerales bacterium]|nr:hypothetical protein [Hyphomonadaceae bacterium]